MIFNGSDADGTNAEGEANIFTERLLAFFCDHRFGTCLAPCIHDADKKSRIRRSVVLFISFQ